MVVTGAFMGLGHWDTLNSMLGPKVKKARLDIPAVIVNIYTSSVILSYSALQLDKYDISI